MNNWEFALDALIQKIDYRELVEIILTAKIGKGNYKVEWLTDDEFALSIRKPVYEKISDTEYRQLGNFLINAARCTLRICEDKEKITQICVAPKDMLGEEKPQ